MPPEHAGFGVEDQAAHGFFEFGGVAAVAVGGEDGADLFLELFDAVGGGRLGAQGCGEG